MGSISRFLENFDYHSLILALMSAVAALLCFTVHELCHGLTAYKLGDPTAKNAGRLTLNPIRHIDWFGLLLMITVRVGWAKPVPVDMRNFKHPKRDMALTALAGPLSNFVLAWVFLLLVRVLGWVMGLVGAVSPVWLYVLSFFLQAALLSVGLGVFNLIPIPPLDGSKVLFSLFPNKIYYTILRYERYIMALVFVVMWTGILNVPLSYVMTGVLRGLCLASGVPFELFYLVL